MIKNFVAFRFPAVLVNNFVRIISQTIYSKFYYRHWGHWHWIQSYFMSFFSVNTKFENKRIKIRVVLPCAWQYSLHYIELLGSFCFFLVFIFNDINLPQKKIIFLLHFAFTVDKKCWLVYRLKSILFQWTEEIYHGIECVVADQ